MDLDRIAVALALTRFMLNLPYSSWMTTVIIILFDLVNIIYIIMILQDTI